MAVIYRLVQLYQAGPEVVGRIIEDKEIWQERAGEREDRRHAA